MIESLLWFAAMGLTTFLAGKVVRRRALGQRLLRPMLNGVYLPAVNDVRWRRDNRAGAWLRLGKFRVDPRDGEVVLDNETIGCWPDYADAVISTALLEQRNQLALIEIERAE